MSELQIRDTGLECKQRKLPGGEWEVTVKYHTHYIDYFGRGKDFSHAEAIRKTVNNAVDCALSGVEKKDESWAMA